VFDSTENYTINRAPLTPVDVDEITPIHTSPKPPPPQKRVTINEIVLEMDLDPVIVHHVTLNPKKSLLKRFSK
jgi:hypothetical protein